MWRLHMGTLLKMHLCIGGCPLPEWMGTRQAKAGQHDALLSVLPMAACFGAFLGITGMPFRILSAERPKHKIHKHLENVVSFAQTYSLMGCGRYHWLPALDGSNTAVACSGSYCNGSAYLGMTPLHGFMLRARWAYATLRTQESEAQWWSWGVKGNAVERVPFHSSQN